MHFNLSLSSDKTSTVAGTPLGELLVGGWAAAEAGVNVGAIAGEPGMNVGAFGDKVDGCAARWRLAAGIKVVAVGDSVESMGVEVASGADKGVDCVGCA